MAKKDKKKVEVVEETVTDVVEETKVEVVEETVTDVVEETKVEATPDNDENNGEGVSTETAKAKKSKGGEVKFRSSGHTKLYAKLDPESRYAKNMVRRYAK